MPKKKERKFTFALNVNDQPDSAVGHFLNVYDSGLMSKQYLLREAVVSGSFLHKLGISRGVVDLEASGQLSRMSDQDKARWLMAQCKMFLDQSSVISANDLVRKTISSVDVDDTAAKGSEESVSALSEEKNSQDQSQKNVGTDVGEWANMGFSDN